MKMRRHHFKLAVASIAVIVFGQGSFAQTPAIQPASKYWVTEATNDTERFQRIEKYLRGFDQPMWEVGERYEKLYGALLVENFELASYHWAKIKLTIENGTMKRPARKASADAIFLGSTWDSVYASLASGDQMTAWKGFKRARSACMRCHDAENVSYMNNQPMFTELTPHLPNTK